MINLNKRHLYSKTRRKNKVLIRNNYPSYILENRINKFSYIDCGTKIDYMIFPETVVNYVVGGNREIESSVILNSIISRCFTKYMYYRKYEKELMKSITFGKFIKIGTNFISKAMRDQIINSGLSMKYLSTLGEKAEILLSKRGQYNPTYCTYKTMHGFIDNYGINSTNNAIYIFWWVGDLYSKNEGLTCLNDAINYAVYRLQLFYADKGFRSPRNVLYRLDNCQAYVIENNDIKEFPLIALYELYMQNLTLGGNIDVKRINNRIKESRIAAYC